MVLATFPEAVRDLEVLHHLWNAWPKKEYTKEGGYTHSEARWFSKRLVIVRRPGPDGVASTRT